MEQNPGGSGAGGYGGTGSADFTNAGTAAANSEAFGEIRRAVGMPKESRAKSAREARRAAQFAKFRLTELNLIPLVDTFVSIVFFALTAATVGELTPVVPGVSLPNSRVGEPALQQITIGVGSDVSLAGQRLMSLQEAAAARSNVPNEPLIIPALYSRLALKADSIRAEKGTPKTTSVDAPLAIQGDKTMRYDVLARIMQSARKAGFSKISLQVNRTDVAAPAAAGGST